MNAWRNYVDAAAQLADYRAIAGAEVRQLSNEQQQRRALIPVRFQKRIEHVEAAEEEGERLLSKGRQKLKNYGIERRLTSVEPTIDPSLDAHIDVGTATRRAGAALDELTTAAMRETKPSEVFGVIAGAIGALLALAVAVGVVVLIVIQFI